MLEEVEWSIKQRKEEGKKNKNSSPPENRPDDDPTVEFSPNPSVSSARRTQTDSSSATRVKRVPFTRFLFLSSCIGPGLLSRDPSFSLLLLSPRNRLILFSSHSLKHSCVYHMTKRGLFFLSRSPFFFYFPFVHFPFFLSRGAQYFLSPSLHCPCGCHVTGLPPFLLPFLGFVILSREKPELPSSSPYCFSSTIAKSPHLISLSLPSFIFTLFIIIAIIKLHQVELQFGGLQPWIKVELMESKKGEEGPIFGFLSKWRESRQVNWAVSFVFFFPYPPALCFRYKFKLIIDLTLS